MTNSWQRCRSGEHVENYIHEEQLQQGSRGEGLENVENEYFEDWHDLYIGKSSKV